MKMHLLNLIVILFGLLFGVSARLPPQSPLVYPLRTEIVVDQHTTLTLGCRGTELLTWTFPAARERQMDNSSHIISKINRKDRDYKFESILVVENVTHVDVGFYHCHGQIVDFNTGLRSNKIYVYVYGNILSATTAQVKEFGSWSGIFPCRPTSPDITIDLTCGTRFKILVTPRNYTTLVKYSIGWVRFYPYIGFTVRNIEWIWYWNCSCHFTRDLTVSSIHFDEFRDIDGYAWLHKYGWSFAQSPEAVNVGDNVSVQCAYIGTALFPYYTFEFFWTKCDQHYINERSTVKQKLVKLKPVANAIVTTLTIQNISTADEGCYQCYAYNTITKLKRYEEKHIFVNDADARRGAPRIYDPDQQEIQVMSGGNVTLRCKGSRPVTWSGPARKEEYLSSLVFKKYSSDEIEHMFDEQSGRYKSILHLVRLRYNDTGFYYCHENGTVPTKPFKSRKLYIFVKDGIHLSTKKNYYHYYFVPYANRTVPCLPTSRDVNVSLSMWDERKWDGKRVRINRLVIYEFDARTGFIIQMPDTDFYFVEAECTFTTQIKSSRRRIRYYRDDFKYRLKKILEPTITGPHEDFVSVGETLELSCAAVVYNVPGVTLRWTLPNNSSSNDIWRTHDIINIKYGKLLISKLVIYDAKSEHEGRYNCTSTFDNATATRYISLFDKFILEDPTIQNLTYDYAYIGQLLLIQCVVHVDHNIAFQMAWTTNIVDVEEMINKTEYIEGIRNMRGQNILEIYNVTYGHVGIYTCHVNYFENGKKNVTKYVYVKEGKPVRLVADNKKLKHINVEVDESVNLTCSAEGDPKPTITWKKGSTAVNIIGTHIAFSPGNTTLSIFKVSKTDVGDYTCEARNPLGHDVHTIRLNVSKIPLWAVITISILILLIIVTLLLNYRATCRCKIFSRKDMINFKFGETGNINSLLNAPDGLLPYDTKWEISRESVELGRNLGSGCFGLVVQATVSNFFDGEPVKTVAVKKLLPNSSFLDLHSLICELKILSHLGIHANVINLLGACTENVTERNLLVVIEYCENGSLRDYLIKNRGNFVNLINPDTDLMSFIPEYKASPEDAGPSSAGDVEVGLQCGSTLDLLCWALQVTQGMGFLAANKVLHGDLALRNVLLTENYLAKISDFGLSRNLGPDNCYKKKTQGPLPIKWMALESIRDKTFSTQSDVWSFGVLMWELFSLGRTPYPELEADFRFYRKLASGYRLERPEFSTKEIYQVMLECWCARPVCRPTFPCLARTLEDLLPEHVRKWYTFDNQYDNVWEIKSTEQVADLPAGNSPEEDVHTSDWIPMMELVTTV